MPDFDKLSQDAKEKELLRVLSGLSTAQLQNLFAKLNKVQESRTRRLIAISEIAPGATVTLD